MLAWFSGPVHTGTSAHGAHGMGGTAVVHVCLVGASGLWVTPEGCALLSLSPYLEPSPGLSPWGAQVREFHVAHSWLSLTFGILFLSAVSCEGGP